MATTLLDNLRSQMQERPRVAATDETQRAQELLRARSGKAVGGGASPRASSQAEVAAQDATQLQLNEGRQQGVLQSQALGQQQQQQEQQFSLQNRQMDEKQIDVQEEFNRRMESTLASFDRENRQVDIRKDGAKLDQAGFMLRLSSEQYMEKLQQEAQRANLSEEIEFNEALRQAVFVDELDLMHENLEFRRIIEADDREFNELISSMSTQTAVAIAAAQSQAAAGRGIWEGVSGIASASIDAAEDGLFDGEGAGTVTNTNDEGLYEARLGTFGRAK